MPLCVGAQTPSALQSSDPFAVAAAARELGRLERPADVERLLPLLSHPRAEVRREAANAAGQSVAALPRGGGAPVSPELNAVAGALLKHLHAEDDPYVRGTVAETLGRLPYRDAAAVGQAETALLALLPNPDDAGGPLHPASVTGVVKGLEALIRTNRPLRPPQPATVQRLRALATWSLYRLDPGFIAVRRMAWLAVNAAAAADRALVETGAADPDAQVRRLAIAALATLADVEGAAPVLTRALADSSFHVRYEAVRVYGRLLEGRPCTPLVAATRDTNAHVAMGAIDAMSAGCQAQADAVGALAERADDYSAVWQRPAHALVTLATVAREEAVRRLPRFATSPVWQMRAYAARAAATVGDPALLERLAKDEHDNVRYDALIGLRRVRGHAADDIFVDALSRRDYQLVLAAADALEGSTHEDAVPELLDALERLTDQRRETSRDPRVAIVTRLGELGTAAQAPALRGCLEDFDPVVANACAGAIERWTATRPAVQPRPMASQPADAALPYAARVTMRGAGTFDLALLVDDAPASVARFARLVRERYYDGLTFHRVLPNFIIQGGSPGANEYSGDGPFMRDELGLQSNLRGTVGVSTRGRNTGDAQFFVNLLDNPRLDHEYTVFAEVVSGMDVVDAILEGDVIERIELR